MEYATERDWIAETSGNAAADRDEFERWALSLRGAPSRRDPQVWSYLITMADEMASIERGAYGQPYPGLENTVAAGVVARFQAEAMTPNARRARGSRVPAFRSYIKNRSSRLPEPPPPPAAVQSLRRSRMRDEDDDSRPFDPEERVPFGTKPHHFSYPNPGRRSQEMLPPRRPVLPPRRR